MMQKSRNAGRNGKGYEMDQWMEDEDNFEQWESK